MGVVWGTTRSRCSAGRLGERKSAAVVAGSQDCPAYGVAAKEGKVSSQSSSEETIVGCKQRDALECRFAGRTLVCRLTL